LADWLKIGKRFLLNMLSMASVKRSLEGQRNGGQFGLYTLPETRLDLKKPGARVGGLPGQPLVLSDFRLGSCALLSMG
jgi:hypothetical protein